MKVKREGRGSCALIINEKLQQGCLACYVSVVSIRKLPREKKKKPLNFRKLILRYYVQKSIDLMRHIVIRTSGLIMATSGSSSLHVQQYLQF